MLYMQNAGTITPPAVMHGRWMNVKSTERQCHHASAFENFTLRFCSVTVLTCFVVKDAPRHSIPIATFQNQLSRLDMAVHYVTVPIRMEKMATKDKCFPLFDARVPLFNPVLDPREPLGLLLWFIPECLIGWPTNQRFHYGIRQAINKLSREKCCDSVVNPIT